MTPQERDLIINLLARLKQQGNQPKDPEADALIRQGMAEQPDAPYLLVQTVLIQDMALHHAQDRMAELERQLAAQKPEPAQQPQSFLGNAGRGSVPSAGSWSAPQAAPADAPVWTQSRGAAPMPAPAPAPAYGPQLLSASGSGFLRQAAATAAGIAGGALLFQGIESLFGPHYGAGFLGATAGQPGLSETVINNYYGDQNAPETGGSGLQSADLGDDSQQYADQDVIDTDLADQQDMGDDASNDDV